jgi:basic membrane protein A
MGTSRTKMALLGAPMLILLMVLLPACGSNTTTSTGPKFQVGLVTDIGGLNDRGFNQLAHEGYEKAEKQYGFKDSIIQSPTTNPNYKAELTQAAESNDLVIGVGFLMAQAIDQVAKTFPDKKFALVDSCAASDANGDCDTKINNVTPLLFKEQQAGCLAGVVAGQMEKDGKAEAPKLLGANTIGAVGGISIPPVDHYIAGYRYCAQQVDPNVKVIVTYSNDFTDTTKCQAPADAMIKQKQADIIFQVAGGCGIGALDAAAADGVYGIGVDTDQGYLHPDSIITSALKRVDTAVYTIIDLTEKGQYPSDPNNFPRFDLNNDGVGVAPLGSAVPSDVQPVLNQYISEIKAGTLSIPDSCAPAQTCASS